MAWSVHLRRTAILLIVGCPAAIAAQKAALPEGTYSLTFCYPTCRDSSSVVGTGSFVYVNGDIRNRMPRRLAKSLGGDLNFLLLGSDAPPNACFRASAQRTVAGQEYYVGIIRASLTRVTTLANDSVSIGLYASPDAFFHAVVSVDSQGVLEGIGRQRNWDGSKAPLSHVTGRRTGEPDPAQCSPDS
jgi:hypothetical protein